MKKCCSCEQLKEHKYFHRDRKKSDGYYPSCIACRLPKIKKTREKDLIRAREYEKKKRDRARQNNPEAYYAKRRATAYKYRYGISLEDREEMLKQQNYACAICLRKESELSVKLYTDHDHSTGAVRGLLCPSCNRGLGLFLDNTKALSAAVRYIQSSQGKKEE